MSKHGINKEFDVLIAALPRLQRRWHGVRVVLTGTPEESRWSRRSQQLAEQLGVAERVHFAGDIPNAQLPEHIRRARLLIYPTWCESFGLPVAEALAMGAPAVAADIPACREVGGDAARYYTSGDAASLADSIAALLDDPNAIADLASAAHERGKQFTWRANAVAVRRVAGTRNLARLVGSAARRRARDVDDERMKAPVSVLVPTLDEELNLPECLDSLVWADEVFVVDSFSQDRTLEIARGRGAHVVQHAFENYSRQKNWALDTLPFTPRVGAHRRCRRARDARAALRNRVGAGCADLRRVLSQSSLHLSRHLDSPRGLVSELEPAAVSPPARALRRPRGARARRP